MFLLNIEKYRQKYRPTFLQLRISFTENLSSPLSGTDQVRGTSRELATLANCVQGACPNFCVDGVSFTAEEAAPRNG